MQSGIEKKIIDVFHIAAATSTIVYVLYNVIVLKEDFLWTIYIFSGTFRFDRIWCGWNIFGDSISKKT